MHIPTCSISIKRIKMRKLAIIVCANNKNVIPLHRQKVNRLFRLVVIDLGF